MARTLRDLIAEARSQISEVEPAEAAEALRHDARLLVLDVREPAEFEAGHLPRAVLVPRGMLEAKAAGDSPARDSQLADPARPILAYCGSGARSALAAVTLQTLGFTNVRSLAGGFQAWDQQGLPVE